jgi:hypothetical protein
MRSKCNAFYIDDDGWLLYFTFLLVSHYFFCGELVGLLAQGVSVSPSNCCFCFENSPALVLLPFFLMRVI